jgi:hypothetical protein
LDLSTVCGDREVAPLPVLAEQATGQAALVGRDDLEDVVIIRLLALDVEAGAAAAQVQAAILHRTLVGPKVRMLPMNEVASDALGRRIQCQLEAGIIAGLDHDPGAAASDAFRTRAAVLRRVRYAPPLIGPFTNQLVEPRFAHRLVSEPELRCWIMPQSRKRDRCR